MFCSFYLILYIIWFHFSLSLSPFYYFDYYEHQYFTYVLFQMFFLLKMHYLDHILERPIGPLLKVVQLRRLLTGPIWRPLCLNFSALPAIHVLRSVALADHVLCMTGRRHLPKVNFVHFMRYSSWHQEINRLPRKNCHLAQAEKNTYASKPFYLLEIVIIMLR